MSFVRNSGPGGGVYRPEVISRARGILGVAAVVILRSEVEPSVLRVWRNKLALMLLVVRTRRVRDEAGADRSEWMRVSDQLGQQLGRPARPISAAPPASPKFRRARPRLPPLRHLTSGRPVIFVRGRAPACHSSRGATQTLQSFDATHAVAGRGCERVGVCTARALGRGRHSPASDAVGARPRIAPERAVDKHLQRQASMYLWKAVSSST